MLRSQRQRSLGPLAGANLDVLLGSIGLNRNKYQTVSEDGQIVPHPIDHALVDHLMLALCGPAQARTMAAPFTPFRGDSYAYARDTSTMPNRGYIADSNGPRCMPGQLTTINGQRMTCQ